MSGFGSDLHRFGLDPEAPPDQAQWASLCRLIRALLNNPRLNIGSENSEFVLGEPPAITMARGTGEAGPCLGSFGRVYKDTGNWMLSGGIVTGGANNETVAPINLGTVGSEPADGKYFWLVCPFTATVEDGVLLPGGTLGAVTVGDGTTVPDNDMPTVADPSGGVHISLGMWQGNAFYPTRCGDITITHCLGSLTY